MKNMYTLKQAWDEAHRLIPAGLELDPESVARAGYPIYRSPVDRLDYVCDLTARLEVNLHNGNKSINLYIDYESEVDSMNTIDTTVQANNNNNNNNNESEVANMIDATITTAPVTESTPADTITADQTAAEPRRPAVFIVEPCFHAECCCLIQRSVDTLHPLSA